MSGRLYVWHAHPTARWQALVLFVFVEAPTGGLCAAVSWVWTKSMTDGDGACPGSGLLRQRQPAPLSLNIYCC